MIVRKLFTDGGLITPNPSKVGGLWAWCEIETAVDGKTGEMTERIFASNSGIVFPNDLGRDVITSPNMEVFAIVEALEQIGDNPQGANAGDDNFQHIELHVDNSFALGAFVSGWKTDSIPWTLLSRVEDQLQRIESGRLFVSGTLLGGHPNPEDLLCGIRRERRNGKGKIVKTALPCSQWNVWCDDELARRIGIVRVELGIDTAPEPPRKPNKSTKRNRAASATHGKNAIVRLEGHPLFPVPLLPIVVPALASASVKAEQMDMFAGAA